MHESNNVIGNNISVIGDTLITMLSTLSKGAENFFHHCYEVPLGLEKTPYSTV